MSSAATQRVYHVMQRGRRYGPLSRIELSTRVLTNDMLVWREGMTEWVPIGTIEELRPYLRHAAAVATTAPPTSPPAAKIQPPTAVSMPPVPAYEEPEVFLIPRNRVATTIGWLNIVLGTLGIVVWPIALLIGPAVVETSVAGATDALTRPGVRLGNSVLTALGVLVSVPLLTAGIGLVRRRAWGRMAAIASAWSCLLLQLAIIAFTIGFVLVPMMATTAEADPTSGPGGAIGGLVLGLVVATASCGYHVWQLVTMRSQVVTDSLD